MKSCPLEINIVYKSFIRLRKEKRERKFLVPEKGRRVMIIELVGTSIMNPINDTMLKESPWKMTLGEIGRLVNFVLLRGVKVLRINFSEKKAPDMDCSMMSFDQFLRNKWQ